jgi:hypothetical protein
MTDDHDRPRIRRLLGIGAIEFIVFLTALLLTAGCITGSCGIQASVAAILAVALIIQVVLILKWVLTSENPQHKVIFFIATALFTMCIVTYFYLTSHITFVDAQCVADNKYEKTLSIFRPCVLDNGFPAPEDPDLAPCMKSCHVVDNRCVYGAADHACLRCFSNCADATFRNNATNVNEIYQNCLQTCYATRG